MLPPERSANSTMARALHSLPRLEQPKSSKQNSWAQYALRGLRDFLHVVTPNGEIRYVSDSCKLAVGYERNQLLGRVIHNFIHPDDLNVFSKEFHEVLLYGIPTRFIYRFRTPNNGWTILESQCRVYHESNNASNRGELIVVARPYLTRSNVMLDSFLEYKVANEKLYQRLQQLKDVEPTENGKEEEKETEQEEEEEQGEEEWGIVTDSDASNTQVVDGVCVAYARPQESDHGHHEVGLHVQVEIAWFTPERQLAGNSTSSQKKHVSNAQADNGEAIGDMGIPYSTTSKKETTLKRKSKKRKPKDYICMICGTVESPEWRRGPHGPKTLCNRCGLRWSKLGRRVVSQQAIGQYQAATRR